MSSQHDDGVIGSRSIDEAILRTITERLRTGVYTLDREGRFTYVSRFIAQSSGFPAEAFVGRHFVDLIQSDDRERVRESFERALAGEAVPPYELAYHPAAGGPMWVEVDTEALVVGGEVVGVLGVSRNISVRKRMEAELRESEDKYRSLVEALPHGVLIAQDDTVVFANAEASRLLGVEQLEGTTAEELLALVPYDGGEPLRGPGRAPLSGAFGDPRQITVSLMRTDGRRIVADMYVHAMSFQGRPALQLLLIDRTERERLEAQVRQQQKMEAIGTLAGGIAHDFNNLLTGILGMASLLRLRADPGSPQAEAAGTIERAAEQASALTGQLVRVARTTTPVAMDVCLHRVVREVSALLRRTVDPRIEIVERLEARRSVLRGDPSQVQQVVMNLAVNARDAMPEGGTLSLATRLSADGKRVELSVVDTGLGMQPDVSERIFEPFFTTKPSGRGSGMGLAVAYGIVKSHSGEITVSSELGKGSSFRVSFPLVEGQDDRPRSERGPSIAGTGTILVVDDEPLVRDAIQMMLQSLGYRVVALADGESALAAFREPQAKFDLVVLDHAMRPMDGLECAAAFRSIDPGARLLLATGSAVDGEWLRRHGAVGIGLIHKPFTLAEISEAVASALADEPGGEAGVPV